MAFLMTQATSNILEQRWPGLGNGVVPLSDPPTAAEVWARKIICEILLDIYLEDPGGFPEGDLKNKWNTMPGAERVDMIAEGMAILWP